MEDLKKSHINITYPKTKENNSHNLDESVLKDPVILIFGWLGADDRYLKAYSEIYEEKAFSMITVNLSPITIMMKHKEMMKHSEKLMGILDEHQFRDRPVIVHLFSNGGAIQYESFSEALQKNQAKSKLVKGVIIDSGPAKITLRNYTLVIAIIMEAIFKTKLLVYPLTLMSMALFLLHRSVTKIKRDIFKMPVNPVDPYNNLKEQENLCPQLFIYSKADRLVPYKDLEEFIERRKAIGVDVTTKLYEKTSHVKHYPSDKLGYCKTVIKFVNKVLKK